ncbi:unnamed protein product [Dicrocoelium dendriticum]|nr:unnamed protein product [Dicrocoelium dendriticum]
MENPVSDFGSVKQLPQITDSSPPTLPLPIPPDIPRDRFQGLRSILTVWLLLLSAYLGSIFLQGPLVPLAIFAPKLFRRFVDYSMNSWFMFTEFLLLQLMQVRARHFGDSFLQTDAKHSTLLLMNHRTQLDWLFSWGLGQTMQKMKIVLKESMAKIPGAGWAMQCASFIFLRRQMATDQERIERTLTYLINTGGELNLFMFPEGTNSSPHSLSRSNRFAEKYNMPYVAYTLHPRCTGFVYLATLLGRARLKYIYDVTVAYPDHLPSPDTNIFFGQTPREVHYHVSRIEASELPWVENAITEEHFEEQRDRLIYWLRSRWLAKESLLKVYYSRPLGQRRFDNEIPPRSRVFLYSPNSECVRLAVFGMINTAGWFIGLILSVYLLYSFWIVRLYAIAIQLFLIYLSYAAGGVSLWASSFVDGPRLSCPVEFNRVESNAALISE